jgi:porin
VGVFFRFGASDGIANPIKYHYNAGIGGKGAVPGRPQDAFGVGWTRIEFSSSLVPFLRQRLGLGLDHEDVVELFYNLAITPWFHATADLQIAKPGLAKFLNSANQLQDVSTAGVGGLRVYTRF